MVEIFDDFFTSRFVHQLLVELVQEVIVFANGRLDLDLWGWTNPSALNDLGAFGGWRQLGAEGRMEGGIHGRRHEILKNPFLEQCLQLIYFHDRDLLIISSPISPSSLPIGLLTSLPSKVRAWMRYNFIMSLLQEHQIETSVYLCSFQCLIRQANIAMKFPCSYFVEWRTINSKATARTTRHPPRDNQVTFEETISLQLEMLYDHAKLEFLRRETIVELYLVSKSRPDQNKLVGRVSIDLGKVVNVGMYEEPTEFRLNFCSVEGSLIMQFRPLQQQLTSLTIQDLDKSSFIDFISQNALKNQTRNQSMIHGRNQSSSVDKDRQGRSEIRGQSPGSPKGVLKSSVISRSNYFKTDKDKEMRESINPRETKAESNRPANEEPQGKPRAGLVSSKVNFNMNNLFDHDLPPQNKNNEEKRPSEKAFLDVIPQDDIVTSQTYDLQNILKTSSSPIFETPSPNMASNEARQSYGSLTFGQQQRIALEVEQVEVKPPKQQMLQGEVQKLQSQVSKLLDQNELLFQEKQISNQRYQDGLSALEATKQQYRDLQQKCIDKDRTLQQMSAEAIDKERLIQQLQTQVNTIYQTNKKQQNYQIQNLKAKVSLFEALTKQQNDNFKTSATSYQKKLTGYQQIISQLEKDKEQLEKHKEEREEKIKTLASQKDALKTRLDDLQSENHQLTNCLQQTRQQLQQLRSTRLKQSVSLEQQTKDRNELNMEVQRVNQELDSTLVKYDQLEKELSEIQGKYLQLESLYDEQVNANQQLHLQLHQLQVNKQQQKGKIPQEEALNCSEVIQTIQSHQYKQEVEKLRLENQSLTNQVEFLKSHTQMNEQLFNSTVEGLRHEKEALLEQILTLEDNMATTTLTFQAKITQLLTSNAELFSDNQSMKAEILQLNRQLYENEWMETEKALQEENEQLREQARVIEAQVELYEKELLVLKEQITRIRQNKETRESRESKEGKLDKEGKSDHVDKGDRVDKAVYDEMVGKLSANLEEQINQNTQLSQAIVRYMQKEAKMKETLAVLEQESKEIFTLVQEKEQNEETYQKAIQELQQELLTLRNQQPSPTHSNQSSPQRERVMQEKAELMVSIKQQQETIDRQSEQLSKLNEQLIKLNEQLVQLSQQYSEEKARLESEVSHLTEGLILGQSQSKREEQAYATKCKEYERSIKNRDVQLEILKSRGKQREAAYRGLEDEILRLRSCLEQIEELKFNLQSTNNEKDIRIIELQDEVASIIKNTAPRPSPPNQPSSSQFSMLEELKERLLQKNLNADWDSLLQSILDRSMNGQETGRLLNLEEKSRLLSKELQKMKAQLLKSEWRNHQEKVAAMGLFKKCESIVAQLITAAESLNQNQSSFL